MLTRLNDLLKNHRGLAGAALFLIPFVVFALAGALANGFVYDDGLQILENPFVLNPALWSRIFTGSVMSFQGSHMDFYRPLQIFAYWLVYRVAGPNPSAFHLLNLLLYAATVWLIFRLGRELLENHLAAFVGATLWALHPLHVEAVAWISALPDVGCGFFYLLAFLLFLRADRSGEGGLAGHALAALAYLPALFFKETALSFPLLLLAYWILLPGRSATIGWPGRLLRWAPYGLAVAAYLAVRTVALGRIIPTSNPWRVTLPVMSAAAGLLGQHTRLFFWPVHLNVFRTFELTSSLRSPWLWITMVTLLAVVWVRKRDPALGFLIIWWPMILAPALDIRYLSSPLLAERFSYLPSVGLCFAISSVMLLWAPRWVSSPKVAGLVLPGLALVMLLLAAQTARAIANWRDNETLLQYSIKQSPNAAALHFVRGIVLQYERGDVDGAVREFETALALNRTSLRPLPSVTYNCYLSLGQIAHQKGRPEEAVRYFEEAIQVLHDMSAAYDYLGSFYFPRRDYAKAAEYFSQAVKVNSYDVVARFFLGTCWMKLGRYQEAAEQFRAAREVDPAYWQAFEAEARALEAQGDSAAAARVRSLKGEAR